MGNLIKNWEFFNFPSYEVIVIPNKRKINKTFVRKSLYLMNRDTYLDNKLYVKVPAQKCNLGQHETN